MLAIKCTSNIFLISVYVSLQQDIWYVKMGVLKNWKQLFLSVTYSYLLGQEYGIYLFLFLAYIITRYLCNMHEKKFCTHEITHKKNIGPTKYPPEKILDPRNIHEKIFGPTKQPREKIWTHEIPTRKNFGPTKYPREKIFEPTKYPREKIADSRNTHEKNFWTHEGTVVRWHKTHETHHSTRPTEFSTLNIFQEI